MSEKITFRTFWHASGVSAIVLSSVSIAYLLISSRLNQPDGATWMLLLSYVLLAARIFLSVWLLFIFMIRFKGDNPDADRADIRHLGMLISFLAALIYATAVMAFYRQHPDLGENAVKLCEEVIKTTPGAGLDSNSMEMLRSLRNNFPSYMFVSELVNSYLIGWLLSAILAAKIVKNNQ